MYVSVLTRQFFYERWGDAPVHSIAASLFLNRSQIHHFEDIGYRHVPWAHCPANRAKYHDTGKCLCDPTEVRMLPLITVLRPGSVLLHDPVVEGVGGGRAQVDLVDGGV